MFSTFFIVTPHFHMWDFIGMKKIVIKKGHEIYFFFPLYNGSCIYCNLRWAINQGFDSSSLKINDFVLPWVYFF